MIGLYVRVVLLCSLSFVCCSSPQIKEEVNKLDMLAVEANNTKSINHNTNYDFENPTNIYVLDNKLEEVSGLVYDDLNNQFLAVNDEEGIIYSLDPKSFDISSELEFAADGDYEAITIVGDNVVVSQNTGTLFFKDKSLREATAYNTVLNSRNDIEGLCYDKMSEGLLLACKGQPIENMGGKKNQKSVYRFDLAKKELDNAPFLTIHDRELILFLEDMDLKKNKSKLKKLKRRVVNFAPSGIAIHPITGDYYLISAKSSLLVIIDRAKQLKDIIFLNSKSNPQPEGITFGQNHDLFISTEGKGYSGKIFKYAYHQ